MKKILILFSFVLGSLHAEMLYSASGTLIGELMDIRIKHHATAKIYRIEVDMKAVGIAKSMSHGLKERHTSRGMIKKGEYYAKEYKIEKSYKKIRYIRTYRFDYQHQRIIRTSIKWKKGKKLYEKKKTLSYFAHNDLLTLYPNIMQFKQKNKAGKYSMILAGAESEGGKLTFILPQGRALKQEQKVLGMQDADVIKLFIKKSFFSGGKGSLLLGIDKEGVVQRGSLDRVKLLGKVTLKRIK